MAHAGRAAPLTEGQRERVERNLDLASRCARRSWRRGDDLDEMRAESMYCLCRAAQSFDRAAHRDAGFRPYAALAIRRHLAAWLGVRTGRRQAAKTARPVCYHDHPCRHPGPDRMAARSEAEVVLAALPSRLAGVLRMYYLAGMGLAAMAAALGLTRSGAWRRLAAALAQAREG